LDINLSLETLQKTFQKAQEDGVMVRGLVLINPGNPTGMLYISFITITDYV